MECPRHHYVIQGKYRITKQNAVFVYMCVYLEMQRKLLGENTLNSS